MANISIAGGTSPTVAVYGNNLAVTAGIGSDSVGSTSVTGSVSVGKLTTLTATQKLGVLPGAGNDTINLGSGADTIVQSGQATVSSTFNTLLADSSVAGGEAQTTLMNANTDASVLLNNTRLTAQTTLMNTRTDASILVNNTKLTAATVIGGALDETTATAQNGRTDVAGVFSGVKADTNAYIGSTGVDTLTGGAGKNVFEFLKADAGGQHTITNFVSTDQLDVEGYSLSYLQANNDISTQGGNTYISIDGGKTSIELKGFTGLNNSEITTHKN